MGGRCLKIAGWCRALVAPVVVGGRYSREFNGDDVGGHGQRIGVGGITGTQHLASIAIWLDGAGSFA